MGLLIIIILAIILAPIVAILVGGLFGAAAKAFSSVFQLAVVLVIIFIIYGLGATIIDLTENYYPYILPALITLVATVVYFKKKEIKKIYTTIENNLKNKVSKITENFILRTIIVILILLYCDFIVTCIFQILIQLFLILTVVRYNFVSLIAIQFCQILKDKSN